MTKRKSKGYALCLVCNQISPTTRADNNWEERCVYCGSKKVNWYSKRYALKKQREKAK